MPDDQPDDPLRRIEATVLGLVLARIAVRGRLKVETDLRELEELTGNQLPEVRTQLDQMFGFAPETLPVLPAAEPPKEALAPAEPRRRPGRPPRDRNATDLPPQPHTGRGDHV